MCIQKVQTCARYEFTGEPQEDSFRDVITEVESREKPDLPPDVLYYQFFDRVDIEIEYKGQKLKHSFEVQDSPRYFVQGERMSIEAAMQDARFPHFQNPNCIYHNSLKMWSDMQLGDVVVFPQTIGGQTLYAPIPCDDNDIMELSA